MIQLQRFNVLFLHFLKPTATGTLFITLAQGPPLSKKMRPIKRVKQISPPCLVGQNPVILQMDHKLSETGLSDQQLHYVAHMSNIQPIMVCLLQNLQLGQREIEILLPALQRSVLMEELYLFDNQIDGHASLLLCDALKQHPCLNMLDLSENDVSDQAAGRLLGLKIRILNLSQNGIRTLPMTCEMHLTMLDLSHNLFGDQGATSLAAMLKTNKTLRSLDLSKCHITHVGCKALCSVLYHNNRTLETLDLSHNRIGDKGAVYVAHVFHQNPILSCVHLRNNPITYKGERFLEDSLANNTSVKVLDIVYPQLCKHFAQNELSYQQAIQSTSCVWWISTLSWLDRGDFWCIPPNVIQRIAHLVWQSRGQLCWSMFIFENTSNHNGLQCKTEQL